MTGRPTEFLEKVAALGRDGQAFAVATVVARRKPVSAHLGDRAIVYADGRMEGFVGGACSREIARKQALEAIRVRQPRLVSIRPDASEARHLRSRTRRRPDDLRVGGRDRRLHRAVRPRAPAGRGRVDTGCRSARPNGREPRLRGHAGRRRAGAARRRRAAAVGCDRRVARRSGRRHEEPWAPKRPPSSRRRGTTTRRRCR